MKKFLYIMPSVLICMLYALLAALVGGVSGFQPIALVNILCPILAGILLRRDKWWGCLFGTVTGAVLIYNGMTARPQMMAGLVVGLILVAYYLVMGILCAASKNKQ